jgi:hypothetical protein
MHNNERMTLLIREYPTRRPATPSDCTLGKSKFLWSAQRNPPMDSELLIATGLARGGWLEGSGFDQMHINGTGLVI